MLQYRVVVVFGFFPTLFYPIISLGTLTTIPIAVLYENEIPRVYLLV